MGNTCLVCDNEKQCCGVESKHARERERERAQWTVEAQAGRCQRANHLKVVDVAQVVDGVTLVRAVALLSTVIQVPERRKRGASMRCKQTNERANKHNQPQTQTLNPTTPLSTTLATLPSPCADSPHPSIHVFCQRKFRDPNLKRKILFRLIAARV